MNKDTIILFIGGPYDGQRKRWGTNAFVQKVLTMTLAEPIESFYRIEVCQVDGIRHHTAIHSDVQDVMQKLLEGYHPTK